MVPKHFQQGPPFWTFFPIFSYLTNLDIPEHLWQVVGLSSQVEVVEDILLHGVQVWILHMNLRSVDTAMTTTLVTRSREGFM